MDVFFVTIGFILKTFLCTVILNDSARSATYEVDSTVELKCKYSALAGEELKWLHLISPYDVVYSINTEINPDLEGSIKARIFITGNHSAGEYRLKISNLTMSDKGQYQCFISKRLLAEEHTINVIDAPYVKVINVTYSQNDINRTITCEYIGNPITDIFYNWQHKSKYGIIIRKWNNMQSGVLTLPHIPVEKRYQDNGEYECTVRIDVNGNVMEKTGIGSMIVKASPVFTIDNEKTRIAKVSGKTELHVKVYSVPKITTMQWYKGNEIIRPSFKYIMSDEPGKVLDRFHTTDVVLDGYIFSLNISNITVDDFTSYMVKLSNDIGECVNYTITLDSVGQDQNTILQHNALIGGVAGGLGLVITMLVVVFVCYKRHHESGKDNKLPTPIYDKLNDDILFQVSGSNYKHVNNVAYAELMTNANKSFSFGEGSGVVYDEVNKRENQIKIWGKNQKVLNNHPGDEYVNGDLSFVKADSSDFGIQNKVCFQDAGQAFAKQKSRRMDIIIHAEDDRTVYEEVGNST